MLDVEVFGAASSDGLPSVEAIRGLCTAAANARGIDAGHVAIEFVDAARIAGLNEQHRDRAAPTDVLSFPIDGVEPLARERGPGRASVDRAAAGPDAARSGAGLVERELGDIVICPEHTVDVAEAVVHGMLHLLGMDHETDAGEMLAVQARVLGRPSP